jgi:hypothetical protein
MPPSVMAGNRGPASRTSWHKPRHCIREQHQMLIPTIHIPSSRTCFAVLSSVTHHCCFPSGRRKVGGHSLLLPCYNQAQIHTSHPLSPTLTLTPGYIWSALVPSQASLDLQSRLYWLKVMDPGSSTSDLPNVCPSWNRWPPCMRA